MPNWCHNHMKLTVRGTWDEIDAAALARSQPDDDFKALAKEVIGTAEAIAGALTEMPDSDDLRGALSRSAELMKVSIEHITNRIHPNDEEVPF